MVCTLHDDDVVSSGLHSSNFDGCFNGLRARSPKEKRVQRGMRHEAEHTLDKLDLGLAQSDSTLNVDDFLSLFDDRSSHYWVTVTKAGWSDPLEVRYLACGPCTHRSQIKQVLVICCDHVQTTSRLEDMVTEAVACLSDVLVGDIQQTVVRRGRGCLFDESWGFADVRGQGCQVRHVVWLRGSSKWVNELPDDLSTLHRSYQPSSCHLETLKSSVGYAS
jgi:hypothetical protein